MRKFNNQNQLNAYESGKSERGESERAREREMAESHSKATYAHSLIFKIFGSVSRIQTTKWNSNEFQLHMYIASVIGMRVTGIINWIEKLFHSLDPLLSRFERKNPKTHTYTYVWFHFVICLSFCACVPAFGLAIVCDVYTSVSL